MNSFATLRPPFSRWETVSAVPHRIMFLLGAVQLVLAMALWVAELMARELGAPLPFVLASTWMHALLMVYGVFTFFIYGFLFTVFPRWMGGVEVARARYLAVAVAMAVGIATVYVGVFVGRAVVASGVVLYLGGWVGATLALTDVYRRAQKRRVHERLLLLELGLGACGLGMFGYAVAALDGTVYGIARDIGLWGFLLPVLLTVSHRMIPFFTRSALPGEHLPAIDWSLYCFVGGSLLHGIFSIAVQPVALVIVDAGLAAVAIRHTVVWGLAGSFRVRLLAMLHVAFLWYGVAMGLYAAAGLLALLGIGMLGRAPLHALGIGFVTSTLIAMATRVTLGHSGRALTVNAPTWYLFLGISAVALLRIAAELAPTAIYGWLNLAAGAAWIACLLPWAARYAPMYLHPRVDHKPG